jgi:hypothetical protein
VEKRKSMKGFLFVVTVFLILTYILLSISVWVKSIEASERSYAELFKESNIELVVEQVTNEKVDSAASKVLTRGLLVISNHTVEYPMKDLDDLNATFSEWLVNGSPSSAYFEGGVAPSEENSSMKAWANNLNASLSAIGVKVDSYKVYDFKMEQKTIDSLDYSFKLDLSISDNSKTTSVVRTYQISNVLNITGIPDPAIMRETKRGIESRRFFFNSNYSTATDFAPSQISGGNAGQGWFYGYLTNMSEADNVFSHEKPGFILVGNYSEIVNRPDYKEFGAYILTNNPGAGTTCKGNVSETNTFNAIKYTNAGTDCDVDIDTTYESTTTPFIVSPNFKISSAPDCPSFNASNTSMRKCILFVTAMDPVKDPVDKKLSSPTNFYDVEKARDVTLCGLYFKNPDAPSFTQRLLNNSYANSSKEYGISTFIVGKYLLDWNSSARDLSKLDNELFSPNPPSTVYSVRGLPGCKDSGMCGNPNSPTGAFSISSQAISTFGLDKISCDNSNIAGCE